VILNPPRLGVRIAFIFLLIAPAAAGTVSISSPASNSTTGTSVRVTATATSASSVTLMQIYLDGSKKYEVQAAKLDTTLSVTAGSHRVTVVAKDSAGSTFQSAVNFTASTSSTSTTGSTSTTAKTFYDIDHMTGWESCDSCAGWGGDGPSATHSYKQNIASPSIDGKSMEFFLGGTTPYANALWWKQLGGNDWATNFVLDMRYYVKTPSAIQALEFDVNQTRKAEGKWYIFGTQCVMKGTRRWDVYDPYNRKWVATSIPCEVPKAYAWQQVVLEFKRTADAGTTFVSVTINGTKHYFNKTYKARAGSSSTLNAAFQMDGDKYMTDYRVWVDKMSLKIW